MCVCVCVCVSVCGCVRETERQCEYKSHYYDSKFVTVDSKHVCAGVCVRVCAYVRASMHVGMRAGVHPHPSEGIWWRSKETTLRDLAFRLCC